MPVTPVKAQGCTVTDSNGIEYLDCYGGHAVISVGHNHPTYNKRVTDQLNKIAFYSNAVVNPMQEELADRLGLISRLPDYQLFLCNSGAEANENALKLASFVTGRKKVVAFTGSFHGRTSAAVAATHDATINAAINLQHDVVFVELNNMDAASEAIDESVCAVIIEGIQGVAGVIEPTAEFLQHLDSLCKTNGALLILDEVQSGCGRTGNYFAYSSSGINPDLITVAKGIGNGFPVGAVLIAPHIKPKFGMLGTTFGGNYLACAAALAVIEIMEKENLMNNAKVVGEYLHQNLQTIPGVVSVTGRGLMIGIHFNKPIAAMRSKLVTDYQIFTGSASSKNTIRLLPPLCFTKQDANQVLQALHHVTSLQPV